MSSQPSSYYPSNDQPVLFSHHYSSPKLDYLPPLSQMLTDNTTADVSVPQTPTTIAVTSIPSNMMKNEHMVPGVAYYSAQPPSTIFSNSDSPLTTVDLFTQTTTAAAVTTTTADISNDSSNMLTTVPQTIPDTSSMYMNDPVTAATADAIHTNMIYDTNVSSALSTSSMDPLLSTTSTTSLVGNTMCPSTLPPTPIPFFYSNTTTYDSNSSNSSQNRHRQASTSSNSSADNKAYSFVSIPGMNQRKRPRRRYDEIERLYHCTFSGCKKSYGTLNHLNSHVLMQNHGPKRHPSEFKEMRKEWRRQRKQREEQRKQAEKSNKQQQEQQFQQQQQQQLLQQHPLPQQQQQLQPTLTTAFQPPSSYIPTNFPLQSMPLSGFY